MTLKHYYHCWFVLIDKTGFAILILQNVMKKPQVGKAQFKMHPLHW